jgi:hypothetical protein
MLLIAIVMMGGVSALISGDATMLPKAPRSASGAKVRVAGAIVVALSGVALWASWRTIKDYKD